MPEQALLNYIQAARSANIPEPQIRTSLLQSQWSEAAINDALSTQQIIQFSQTPPQPPPKVSSSTTMWDAFEHVLLFISLYVLAISIALMLNSLIDIFSPALGTDTYSNIYNSPGMDTFRKMLMRGYIASLIVTYPLFSFFFLNVTKRTLANTALRNIHARKSLIYLTLIITFIIVIANIIHIIFTLLNGNVTANFFLHFLVSLSISGSIFTYYFLQINEDRRTHA